MLGCYAFPSIGFAQDDFYDINHVSEIRIQFQENNWHHILDSLFINYGENGRLKGNINIDGHQLNDVGVRYKGFSSFSSTVLKNPLNIDLNYTITNQNHKGFVKLRLSNVTHDPSFIREVLSYEIARKYMPASLANFAMVYINDTLQGLYTNVESVDPIFLSKYFPSHNNSFLKGSPQQLQYPFGQNSNLAYTHGSDSSGYIPFYKLESTTGWKDLYNFINILNNDTTNIANVLNIDRALWMHAFNYTLVNLDSYIGYSQNFYLYKDDNGRFNTIPWDLNMSFGSFRNTDATALNLTINKVKQLNPLQLLYTNPFTPRPLIKNLISNSTYRRMFIAHMRTIVNENFRNNEYYNKGKQMQNIADAYVQQDANKFFSYTDFLNNIDSTTGPSSDQYPGIRNLMEERIAYLDTLSGFSGAPSISFVQYSPDMPAKGSEVFITAKISGSNSALLCYREKSNDIFSKTTMFDDGIHNDGILGDSIFGASIITNGNTIQYYIYAENDSAGMFSPERAEYEFYTIQPKINPGEIVINELSTNQIEIFNNTCENYNLKDLYLSDNNSNKWAFPDTVIKSKKFMVVATNQNTTSSFIPTYISVSDYGGELFLSYNNLNIIDSIIYGEVQTGKSIGRYPNGIGAFVYMQPSFSLPNYIGTVKGKDFLVFPNPAHDKIYYEFKNDGAPFIVDILNSSAQSVLTYNYASSNGQMDVVSHSVNITGLNQGVYFIRIVFNDNVMTRKVVIF